jgi:tetratricopeptide (TPR) repeat protein
MRRLLFSVFAAALTANAASTQANAAGTDNLAPGMQLQSANPAAQPKAGPAPRPKKRATTSKRKRAPIKRSDAIGSDGYKQAYDLIYKQQDYAGAIAILTALGRDDHPDVANLIGFASRKLGRTEDAKAWYEKALAADASHTRTLQYYGMWHLERGERAVAEAHLERIRLVCGEDCGDFASLRDALNGDLSY